MYTKLPIFSFFQKLIIFVAWFSKNSRNDFWIRNFKANWLSRHDQKVYSIFQNRAPWGTTFLFKRFHGEKKCLLGFPTMATNSFRIPIVQKFENIFTHIFFIFFCIGIYFLFRSINKIHDDKMRLKQVYLFHANADIKAKFNIFQEVHSQMKAFVTKTAPSWSFCLNALGDCWQVFRIWLDLRWSTIGPCLWKPYNSPRSAP